MKYIVPLCWNIENASVPVCDDKYQDLNQEKLNISVVNKCTNPSDNYPNRCSTKLTSYYVCSNIEDTTI